MAPTSIMHDGTVVYDGEERPDTKQTKREQRDEIGIARFFREIPDEAAAIAFAEECIWGDTPYCPRCGGDNVYRVKNGQPMSHRCRDCSRYFSVRIGTVMEGTNLPIHTWLLAIYEMFTSRYGISSTELGRRLEMRQATAWFLEHRIREAMEDGNDPLMRGIVQVDEMYFGGKERWKHANKKLHKNWRKGKVTVFGLKEDGPSGRAKAFVMGHPSNVQLEDAVLQNTLYGSTVVTDGHAAYRNLSDFGYQHEVVVHSKGQYVNENGATTNGIESLWALFRGSCRGVFHYISLKHLQRYLNEVCYRHNAGPGNGFRTIRDVLCGMIGRRLTYERLTGYKKGQRPVSKPQSDGLPVTVDIPAPKVQTVDDESDELARAA